MHNGLLHKPCGKFRAKSRWIFKSHPDDASGINYVARTKATPFFAFTLETFKIYNRCEGCKNWFVKILLLCYKFHLNVTARLSTWAGLGTNRFLIKKLWKIYYRHYNKVVWLGRGR